jgi:hypothetical protein
MSKSTSLNITDDAWKYIKKVKGNLELQKGKKVSINEVVNYIILRAKDFSEVSALINEQVGLADKTLFYLQQIAEQRGTDFVQHIEREYQAKLDRKES